MVFWLRQGCILGVMDFLVVFIYLYILYCICVSCVLLQSVSPTPSVHFLFFDKFCLFLTFLECPEGFLIFYTVSCPSHIFMSLDTCMLWGGQEAVGGAFLIQRSLIMMPILLQKRAWIWVPTLQCNQPVNLALNTCPTMAMGNWIPHIISKKDHVQWFTICIKHTTCPMGTAMAMVFHQHTIHCLVMTRKEATWVSRGRACIWMGLHVGHSPLNEVHRRLGASGICLSS